MTLTNIGTIRPKIWGGGRFKIPEINSFYQLSGVQFEVTDLLYIPPTPAQSTQTIVEQAIKTELKKFEYEDENLFESVIIGDSKPKGLSMAQINLDEPGSTFNFSPAVGEDDWYLTATGHVTFIFKEELPDAMKRRKYAAAAFIQWMKDNPILQADI